MSRGMKTIIMLMGMFLLLISACSEKEPSKGVATDSNVDPVTIGNEIFIQKCQVCHGAGGKGDIGPDLTDNEWKYGNSDAQLIESISKGRPGGMPGWDSKLSKEKIEAIVSYVKSISGK